MYKLIYIQGVKSICYNGKMVAADQPLLMADNRSYRYGDGLFETIKVENGEIKLANDHFDRLFTGMQLLQYDLPKLLKREKLAQEIKDLCRRNDCRDLARVRLSFSRGNGGLYDGTTTPEYLIECWPLTSSVNQLNNNGLQIDIYTQSLKSCDAFSHLKSANYLPYVMAAQYAKSNRLNDCLVLNTYKRIADASIANVFLIKANEITTPALDEGCVAGVMRKHVLRQLGMTGYSIRETAIEISDVLDADELFLTNAVNGIRWVAQCGKKIYHKSQVARIFGEIMQTNPAGGC